MKGTFHIEIDRPAAHVWAILANEFAEISNWLGPVSASKPQAGPGAGGMPAGRVCDSSFGETDETFVRYDAEAMTFTYEAIVRDAPFYFPVRGGRTTWAVKARGPGRCEAAIEGEVLWKPVLGLLLRPLMGLFVATLARHSLEELKHYAETGEPHPRKLKARAAVVRQTEATAAQQLPRAPRPPNICYVSVRPTAIQGDEDQWR